MVFRQRLRNIENEEELFKFFETHAGYMDDQVYICAGLYASDTAELYEKLKKEWKKEKSRQKAGRLPVGY